MEIFSATTENIHIVIVKNDYVWIRTSVEDQEAGPWLSSKNYILKIDLVSHSDHGVNSPTYFIIMCGY